MPELIRKYRLKSFFVVASFVLSIGPGCSSGSSEIDEYSRLQAEMLLKGQEIRDSYALTSHYMPAGGIKMKINPVGGYLAKVFNDSNHLHMSSATSIGIKPITTFSEAWNAGAEMERLESCKEYYLDELTHSVPYLVPSAHKLLRSIGSAFNDSLQSRGGGNYRIKVTSVTRTPASVARLKRHNVNASENSAHRYGTTFDISYAKFVNDSTSIARTQEDLKNLLAEVLKVKKDMGECYVKYERKQGCFHITVRDS